MNTWARLERADLEAPSLGRDWTVDIPSRVINAEGEAAPYDLRAFSPEAEPALAVLEAAGCERFDTSVPNDDPVAGAALAALRSLGCNFGFSSLRSAGEAARIIPGAPVGGIVAVDSLAEAIEREAGKDDNRAKLREPPDALRRHLCVVIDPSSGSSWSAANQALTGRSPELPEPITTAWVAGGGMNILEVTPPTDWQMHAVPQEVFDHLSAGSTHNPACIFDGGDGDPKLHVWLTTRSP